MKPRKFNGAGLKSKNSTGKYPCEMKAQHSKDACLEINYLIKGEPCKMTTEEINDTDLKKIYPVRFNPCIMTTQESTTMA
jgi:hypothetical protein